MRFFLHLFYIFFNADELEVMRSELQRGVRPVHGSDLRLKNGMKSRRENEHKSRALASPLAFDEVMGVEGREGDRGGLRLGGPPHRWRRQNSGLQSALGSCTYTHLLLKLKVFSIWILQKNFGGRCPRRLSFGSGLEKDADGFLFLLLLLLRRLLVYLPD